MRRHAAYLRFGTTEDDPDPNDDLWELHRRYNLHEPPAPGLCTKAMEAVTNLKLSGRMIVAMICLMLVIRFTIFEDPLERLAMVVTEERKEHVRRFMGSVKGRFDSKRWNASSSQELTPAQLEALTLASNLSAPYETMIMPAMWEGWRRMVQANGAVDANLRRWVELMESLDASDLPKKSILIPDHLKTFSTALGDENVEMFIGVTSGSVQFEQRMGVRRTWAQYSQIRSGRAVLKFFVGLTRTKNMNRRIFKEANLFKDVVILPFVDVPKYSVLKTVAMCLYMVKYTQAPYLLKTEDDTFVRVDTVLPAVAASETRSLLHASIEHKGLHAHEQSPSDSTKKEWPWSSYPKLPRGPGYAISRDIAAFIARQYEDKNLELIRVESVAMGDWVDLYQRQSLHPVSYVNDPAFLNMGCEAGYSIAHGQNLDQMLCLWKRLQNGEGPLCCNNLGAAAT